MTTKYLTTIVLSVAVLNNLLVWVFVTDYYTWIHFGNNLQLLLVCLAGMLFRENMINHFAFKVWFFIVLINWTFYIFIGDHGNPLVTAFGYILAVIFARIMEIRKFIIQSWNS